MDNKQTVTKAIQTSTSSPAADEDDTDIEEGYCLKPVEPPHLSFRDTIPQIVASCLIYCLVIQAGINMSYSSILLPQLLDADSEINVSTDQASWIGAKILTCDAFLDAGLNNSPSSFQPASSPFHCPSVRWLLAP